MLWPLLWRVLKNYPFVLPTGSDAPCLRAGGRCQHDSLTCSGSYRTGLCSGGVRRRCCVPSSSNSGSFSTGKDDVTSNNEHSSHKLKQRIESLSHWFHFLVSGMVSQQCLRCICNVSILLGQNIIKP